MRVASQPAPLPRPSRPASRPVKAMPVGYAPAPVQHPRPDARRAPLPRRKPRPRQSRRRWLIVSGIVVAALALLACGFVTTGALVIYGGNSILRGVETMGIAVGGLSQDEAAAVVQTTLAERGLLLQAGERLVAVDPASIGITVDAEATARAAFRYGRSAGGIPAALRALAGTVSVEPVVSVDEAAAIAGLQRLAPELETPPVNAGIRLVNGQVQPRPAVPGQALDTGLTVAALARDPGGVLADGVLELVMTTVQPAVTDAGPMVAAASALLSSPLHVRAFDPIKDETFDWAAPPETWSEWLTAEPDDSAPLGLRLSIERGPLENFLNAQQTALGSGRYLKLDDAVATVQNAIRQGTTQAMVRVFHHDRQHTVQPGETITSIAWDYGVPYPYIQQANPGIGDSLSPGQTIIVPSPDVFMDYEPVYGKRIVVSISQQRAWVYENGNLKWDWPVSTGISSSPTWPGIYQIISHEPNAYAANWNLWMPYFMGVYRPIPGSDFTNGFHGFPTRGGSQLLWTNSLGTRVTYGCILLSDDNVQQLYNWAEEGVIVEIQA